MKLISWNVNGIRAAEKKGFLDWFSQADADIIGIQETKAREDQLSPDLIAGHGYHAYWHSAQRPGYSGVATFCRTEPLYVQKGMGLERFDAEGRVLITEHENFLFYNIYFPNGQKDEERLQYKLDFYEALLVQLDEQVESGNNVVVGGDWNTAHNPIDLARPRENEKTSGFLPEERALLDKYVAHGYVDTFRHFHPEPDRYSWWTYRFGARSRNVGWRIDYFWVNEGFMDHVVAADIHDDIMGSDHCPVSLELD
ncbi:MAG: exodeoxyribonuclease III [Fidelibacterota bacterium]